MLGALLLLVGCGVPEQVHFNFRKEGTLWVAGHDTHRIEVDPHGRVRFFPIADRDVGPGAGLSFGPAAGRPRIRAQGATLELTRGAVVERLVNTADGLAQSFHFAQRPRGPVVVELAVDGVWKGETARGHHFAPGVAYGVATWIAADGVRVALRTERTAKGLRIRVPDEVVARGPYPAVLDPLISGELGIDLPIQRPPPGQQDHPAVAFDGTRYLVVWRDFRGSLGSDIYGARVEIDGGVLDPGGLNLSVTAGGQYEPAVTFGAGNYYLTFSDTRLGGSDIYGTRVTPAGVPLDGTGIPIGNFTGLQVTSDVSFNGSQYVVVWSDLRASPFAHIYGSRVSLAGAVLDPSPNIAVSVAANGQYTPRVASTDAGTSLIVWEDTRGATSDIYGATLNTAGTVGQPSGFVITNSAQGQRAPDVAFDGTQFLVVWGDSRGGNSDVYGGRVTPTAGLLDGLGFPIGTGVAAQDTPAVGTGAAGGAWLVVWRDFRSGSYDVMGARVNGMAGVLDPMGFLVGGGATAQVEPAVEAGPPGQWLVAFNDQRNLNADIFASRVSSGAALDPAGLNVNLAANLQAASAVATDGNGFLLVWQDYRDGNANIYAAQADATGVLISVPFAVSQAVGDESAPAVAWDGTQYVVVWTDQRAGNADVYAARVGANLVVTDPTGIPVSSGTADEQVPAVVARAGQSFIVWQDLRAGSDIYGSRFSQAGSVLDPAGIPISTASGTQTNPDLAVFAMGYLVVWQDGRNAIDDIYAARVTSLGVVQDPMGIVVSAATGAEDAPAVAADATTALVVWRDTRNGATNGDVFGARMTTAGVVQDATGLGLCTAAGQQSAPEVGFDNATGTFAVFWEDARVVNTTELYGLDVALSGITSVEQPVGSGRAPALVFAPGGPGVLAYSKFEAGVGLNNLRAKYRYVSTVVDAGTPDAGPGDAGSPDAGTPDAGAVDAGAPDAGPADAGPADAGPADAGPADAGVADAGETDAGEPDAGAADAGETDAGVSDAGPSDAGRPDGGAPDAGTSDGGFGPPRTLGVGCGCTSGGAELGAFALLLAARLVRRRARR